MKPGILVIIYKSGIGKRYCDQKYASNPSPKEDSIDTSVFLVIRYIPANGITTEAPDNITVDIIAIITELLIIYLTFKPTVNYSARPNAS